MPRGGGKGDADPAWNEWAEAPVKGFPSHPKNEGGGIPFGVTPAIPIEKIPRDRTRANHPKFRGATCDAHRTTRDLP